VTSETHALYRFYDATGTLLYVGITADPGSRWRKHAQEKPWWQQITSITLETHPTRAAALEAERQAILAEKPVHNVVHNRGTREAPRAVPQLDRIAPYQVGDWVALGLSDGRCPVGEIAALDDTWISVRLKDFMWGSLTNQIRAIRWTEVQRVELAYPEDATKPAPDSAEGFFGATKIMDDKHLGEFQTAWERVHLPDGDPVQEARSAYRREQQEGRGR